MVTFRGPSGHRDEEALRELEVLAQFLLERAALQLPCEAAPEGQTGTCPEPDRDASEANSDLPPE